MKTENIVDDDLNTEYMLSTIATALLCKIVNGEIDVVTLAKTQLANRGQDFNGNWIGFTT